MVRVAPFVKWLKANNKRGFVGEYGVPNNDSRWLVTLDNMLHFLKENGINGTYWAAGPRWNDYILSVEPQNGNDRVQMSVLQNYTVANTPASSIIIDSRSMMHNWEFNRPVVSNNVEGWTIIAYGNAATSGGSLNLQTPTHYNYIKYDITALDPVNTSLHKYAIIRLKNTTYKTQASFYWHDHTAYNNVVFDITANDTDYKEYVINLSANTNWTSKPSLKLIRFDIPMGAITGSENRWVNIDYIKLATTAPPAPLMSNVEKRNILSSVAENDKPENKKAFILYPNPVENHIKLELETADRILKIMITGIDGRSVLESSGTCNEINEYLNQALSSFTPGVYMVKIEDGEKQYSQKMIKKE